MIDCGTNDNSLRECLLHESELTLPNAISAVHAAKDTCKNAHEILKSNGECQSTQDFKTFKI